MPPHAPADDGSPAGLRVHVGAMPPRDAAFLHASSHPDADVPFRLGEEFPFSDGAVAFLVVDERLGEHSFASLVRLFIESRRVLASRGELAFVHGDARLPELAALTGLLPARRAGCEQAYDKPSRTVNATPLVTIAIPAYKPRHFGACLSSALAQTYPNTEIVVCDDAPDDAIAAIVHDVDRARRVRYLRNPARLKPRRNFIRCLEEARGEFVKFLCDDDLLHPRCVERLVDAFRRAPDVTLATSHRRRIDDDGLRLDDQPATLPIVARDSVVAGHALANAMLMVGLNTIGEPSTALFRTADIADQAGRYFHFRGAEGRGVIDMVLWSALLMKGNAVYLCEDLSSFRIHPGQRQNDASTRARNIASIRELQAAWLALGVHEWLPPHLLLTRPFPPQDDGDWAPTRVLGVSAWRVAPAAATPHMGRGVAADAPPTRS